MLDVFGFPSPQQSNCQEFYGGGTTRDWVKPRGASMVRFMLIGAGGGGKTSAGSQGAGGGGSGAVTSWIGPAMFVPDVLRIFIGAGGAAGAAGGNTTLIYQAKDGTGYTLLTANGGTVTASTEPGGAGGAVSVNNYFGAAGIFSSIAGQDGAIGQLAASGGDSPASGTTFLSGGGGGAGSATGTGGTVTPNYGYVALASAAIGGSVAGADGYFITQPILVGAGGQGGNTSTVVGSAGGKGGVGCGGGGAGEDSTGGRGGDGAVFVWAW